MPFPGKIIVIIYKYRLFWEYFFARGDAESRSKKVYNKKHLRVSASPRE
jgi:hypothetical protein